MEYNIKNFKLYGVFVFRDAMVSSIVTRLLNSTGLVKETGTESQGCIEPMMTALTKSMETIIETGFISSHPYRSLMANFKFINPKWLVHKMMAVSRADKLACYAYYST